MQRDTRPFRVGYAESSFGRCAVCTKESPVIRTGDLQIVKVLGSDVKMRHWECISRTMSGEISRLYPKASEIKGYHRLNEGDQEKLSELVSKHRRPTVEDNEGIGSWVRDTSNRTQGRSESDDFGDHTSWPSQTPLQPPPNAASKSSVAPALGLELHSSTASATLKATPIVNKPIRPTPPDLEVFKANVDIAVAKIEVAKSQVKQELAKRKLLEKQIALRAIQRRLKEQRKALEVSREEKSEEDDQPNNAPEEAEQEEEPLKLPSDSPYADAEAQTEEEMTIATRAQTKVEANLKMAEELELENDELLLADSDIMIAKAEIRVAEAEVNWEEAKLKLLQREMGR